MNHMDFVIENWRENRKYFENYMDYARVIKRVVRRELDDAEVFVFGSVVEGKHTPASDIDILVVSEKMPARQSERARLRAMVFREIDFFAPFEIHLVNPEEFEWYRRFVKKMVRVD